MAFLTPLFLLGALGAAVPFVLHLFAREAAPRLPFSAVRFLRATLAEQTRRKRVSDVLLLLVRIAAIALLAIAFARPFFAGGASAGPRQVRVIAVDRSFSLSAQDTWRRVQEAAKAAVKDTPAGSDVALLTFDRDAEVVLEPTADRDAAASRIDTLTAGSGADQLRRRAHVRKRAARRAHGRDRARHRPPAQRPRRWPRAGGADRRAAPPVGGSGLDRQSRRHRSGAQLGPRRRGGRELRSEAASCPRDPERRRARSGLERSGDRGRRQGRSRVCRRGAGERHRPRARRRSAGDRPPTTTGISCSIPPSRCRCSWWSKPIPIRERRCS